MFSKSSLILAALLLNASSALAAPIRLSRIIGTVEARGSSDSSSGILPRMVDNQIFGREKQSRTAPISRLREKREHNEPGAHPKARATSVDGSLHRRYPRRIYYEYYQKRQSGSSAANPTDTSTATGSGSPSDGSAATPTGAPSPTDTSTAAGSGSPSDSNAPTPTGAPSPTDTSTAAGSGSPSDSSAATPTDAPPPTDTSTAAGSGSPSDSSAATPTDAPSPTDTSTPAGSGSPSDGSAATPTAGSANSGSCPLASPSAGSGSQSDTSTTSTPTSTSGCGCSGAAGATATDTSGSGGSGSAASPTDTSASSGSGSPTDTPTDTATPSPTATATISARAPAASPKPSTDTASPPAKRGLPRFRPRNAPTDNSNTYPAVKRADIPPGTESETRSLPEKRSATVYSTRSPGTQLPKREMPRPEKRSLPENSPRAFPWTKLFRREMPLVVRSFGEVRS